MGQLNFEEFKEKIKEELGSYLPEQDSYTLELQKVEKNNVTQEAVVIQKEGSNLGATMYLEPYFKDYQEGDYVEEICQRIADVYEKNPAPEIDVTDFSNYEQVKDRLEIKMVSKEGNDAYLSTSPHQLNEIGAEIVYVNLGESEMGQATVRVTNQLLHRYGISMEELFAQAMENTKEQSPLRIQSMDEVMREMLGEDMPLPVSESPMYVISNPQRLNGATVILYPDALKEIREKVGSDYYILPSSVHELLAIPKGEAPSKAELRKMVREINESQVEPQERLSGEVYEYKGKQNELHKCVIKERELER